MAGVEGAYWIFGIFAAITASLFEALGENLVKLGYTQVGEDGGWRHVCCTPVWIAGIFCICVLNVSFTLVSYALAGTFHVDELFVVLLCNCGKCGIALDVKLSLSENEMLVYMSYTVHSRGFPIRFVKKVKNIYDIMQ